MAKPGQETEAWRVLLFARNGSELLLFRGASGFRLPELSIPRWERTAPNLNAEAKRLWNLEAVCLFPLEVDPLNGDTAKLMYYVMEVRRPEQLARFAPNFLMGSDFREDSFADRRDFLAVGQGMKVDHTSCSPDQQGPFSEFGAFESICAWVESHLCPLGLAWNGRFDQFQASTSFALVRFQTDRGAVWFKAVGPPNLHEFLITTTLANRFPEHVAELIATHDAWNGWLAREALGKTLFETSAIADWERAVVSLARLQIASVSRIDELLAAGARDLRLHRLAEQSDSFFALMHRMMRTQTKIPPQPLSDGALDQLKQELGRILTYQQILDIPDAIGHLDCNPGNIVVSSAGCTFLDWAEAAIGNPFLTFEYLLEFFRQTHSEDRAAETVLTTSYASVWETLLEPAQVREALRFSPAVAAFAHALALVARRDRKQIEEPRTAAMLRSLTRRMQREVEALGSRIVFVTIEA